MTDLPNAFIKELQANLGSEYDSFVDAMSQPPPISVRYNTRKLNPTGGDRIPWCTSGIYLNERPSFTLDPLFHAGAYYVQEASSMLLEQAVKQSVVAESPVLALDLCAAPGGKSTHLLSLLSRDSLVVSNEVIRSRSGALIENIEKWGYPNSIVTQNDPSDFNSLEDFFDLILVDAPCSGEGLFRKDADAMAEWSPRHVDLCATRQRRILTDIWGSLRPGGIMIYSTCTYNSRENLDNLRWFSQSRMCEFVNLSLDPQWGVMEMNEEGCFGYQCFPHRVRGEGFFFAAVRKTGSGKSRPYRVKDTFAYPGNQHAEEIKRWVINPEEMFFFVHRTQARMLPQIYLTHAQLLLERLHVLQVGTAIGEIKKNKIVPDHALALSVCLDNQHHSEIELTLEDARAYLRMDPLQIETRSGGFCVVKFDGLALGWINRLPGRINNLYPSSRRIRLRD